MYAMERPVTLLTDEQGRYHCQDGPAFVYRDGLREWWWHGVKVPCEVIESPDSITRASIDAEENAEVRRCMLERFGTSRYLDESGAKETHRDDYGILYRLTTPRGPMAFVRVLNCTPNKDGTRREYVLCVDPDSQTALAGVASTWRMTAEQFAPEYRS